MPAETELPEDIRIEENQLCHTLKLSNKRLDPFLLFLSTRV
jgi:hypothetical protein